MLTFHKQVALKDFTTAPYNGKHLVYATTHDSGSSWGSIAFGSVSKWNDLGLTLQTKLNAAAVAPTIFYRVPKSVWMLAYQ